MHTTVAATLLLLWNSMSACTVDALPPYQDREGPQPDQQDMLPSLPDAALVADMRRPDQEDMFRPVDMGPLVDFKTPDADSDAGEDLGADMPRVCEPESLTLCGDSCVDTSSSAGNCGGCGIQCESGVPCEQGTCGCSQGARLCGGACAICPDEKGVAAFGCDAVGQCVVQACEDGFEACAQGCCQAALEMFGVVDEADAVGKHNTLKFDASGKAYMSYYDENNESLVLSTEDRAGGWQQERVTRGGRQGLYSDLFIDAQGSIHIAYFDQGNDALMYATRSAPWGSPWQIERVDAMEAPEETELVLPYKNRISIAAGQTGVHIAFFDKDGHSLVSATRRASGWQMSRESITPENQQWRTGSPLAVEVLPEGTIHALAYSGGSRGLLYISRKGGPWSTVELMPSFRSRAREAYIAVSGDKVYASFLVLNGMSELQLTQIDASASTGFRVLATEQGVISHRLALDSKGKPYLLCVTPSRLVSLKRLGQAGALASTPVVSAVKDALQHFSLATGPGDQPSWSWAKRGMQLDQVEGVNLDRLVPSGAGERVVTQVVDQGSIGGAAPKAALDARGHMHMVYIEGESNLNKGLKYAVWDGIQWRVERLPLTSAISNGVRTLSLAVDGANTPHVVYAAFDSPVYMTKSGDEWVSEKVTSDKRGVGFTEVELDSNGLPHVVYSSGQGVYHTRRTAMGWASTELDSRPIRAYYSYVSFELDDKDDAHVVYYQRPDADVKYVRQRSGQWQPAETMLVVNGIPITSSTGMALGPNGQPHVMLQRRVQGQSYRLEYWVRSLSGWTSQPVSIELLKEQVSRNIATNLSMTLDAQGSPHITYTIQERPSGSMENVYYAILKDGAWETEVVERVGIPQRRGTQMLLDRAERPWVVYGASDRNVLDRAIKVNVKLKGAWQ